VHVGECDGAVPVPGVLGPAADGVIVGCGQEYFVSCVGRGGVATVIFRVSCVVVDGDCDGVDVVVVVDDGW